MQKQLWLTNVSVLYIVMFRLVKAEFVSNFQFWWKRFFYIYFLC